MTIGKTLYKGYASETFQVFADEGETLSKEMLEERFTGCFGCHINGVCAMQATVTVYTD